MGSRAIWRPEGACAICSPQVWYHEKGGEKMKKQVTTWLEAALCDKLRVIAAVEQRTLSGQIRLLVRRYVEQYEQTQGSLLHRIPPSPNSKLE